MQRHRLLTPAVAAAALVVATASPASAGVVDTFPLDDSFAGQTDPGFCGVPGLVVDFTYDQTGQATIRQKGKDGPLYFQGHTRIVQTFTYDGRTITNLMPRILEKDLALVDNGDGTVDLTVLFTGAERSLNEEGRIIAKNDGQLRQLWVIDVEADEILSRETTKESTGTNDDFCAAALADWGL